MGTNTMRMYIMSAIYAQYRLCEYQLQLILLSLVSIFNMIIYLLKSVKGVNSLSYIWLCKTLFLKNKSAHHHYSF